MAEVTICYGMTETSPVSTQTRADDDLERRVVDCRASASARRGQGRRPGDRARPCSAGRRASSAPAATPSCSATGRTGAHRRGDRPAGWMHTGDLATMDDDGYLNIVGRIKDMVIRGGENVYPREIEEFLYAPPRRSRTCRWSACPTRSTARSSAPGWWLRDGPRRRRRGCRASSAAGRLAHFKVPRYVLVRRGVPDDGHRQGAEVQDARGV